MTDKAEERWKRLRCLMHEDCRQDVEMSVACSLDGLRRTRETVRGLAQNPSVTILLGMLCLSIEDLEQRR